jgi:hypothetical protein
LASYIEIYGGMKCIFCKKNEKSEKEATSIPLKPKFMTVHFLTSMKKNNNGIKKEIGKTQSSI